MRNVLVALAGAGLVMLFLLHLIGGGRDAIAAAQAAMTRLAVERDSLVAVVQEREADITSLDVRLAAIDSLAQSWRDSVDVLEASRVTLQSAVREISTLTALQAELRSSFPELGDSAWRMLRMPAWKGDTLGIEYVAVPAWFTETFVIDHQNAAAWREQKDQLLAVDSLRVRVAALQDSVGKLEAANTAAYQSGYDVAYAGYQDLSRKYVRELNKPRITLGSTLRFVAGAGAGVVLGRVLR